MDPLEQLKALQELLGDNTTQGLGGKTSSPSFLDLLYGSLRPLANRGEHIVNRVWFGDDGAPQPPFRSARTAAEITHDAAGASMGSDAPAGPTKTSSPADRLRSLLGGRRSPRLPPWAAPALAGAGAVGGVAALDATLGPAVGRMLGEAGGGGLQRFINAEVADLRQGLDNSLAYGQAGSAYRDSRLEATTPGNTAFLDADASVREMDLSDRYSRLLHELSLQEELRKQPPQSPAPDGRPPIEDHPRMDGRLALGGLETLKTSGWIDPAAARSHQLEQRIHRLRSLSPTATPPAEHRRVPSAQATGDLRGSAKRSVSALHRALAALEGGALTAIEGVDDVYARFRPQVMQRRMELAELLDPALGAQGSTLLGLGGVAGAAAAAGGGTAALALTGTLPAVQAAILEGGRDVLGNVQGAAREVASSWDRLGG